MLRPTTRNHTFEWMGESYAPLIDSEHFMGRSLLGNKKRKMVPTDIAHTEQKPVATNEFPETEKEKVEIYFNNNSQAIKALRTAKSPVLVLRQAVETQLHFKTIVFASGLEPDTHEALNRLALLAEDFGTTHIHFVEITTPHNFKPTCQVEKDMQAFMANHPFNNIELHNYNHYSVEAGIAEFAKSINADLIAIANHGRNSLSGLLIESVPENLVKQGEFPVLSIRV